MEEKFKIQISPHLKEDPNYPLYELISSGKANLNLRLDAAKGLIPFEQELFGLVLTLLLKDTDQNVVQEAKKTIANFPQEIALAFAQSRKSPQRLLHELAKSHQKKEQILTAIALNWNTADKTIEFIATIAPPKVQEIISKNQERLIRFPQIIDALLKNPNLDSFIRMDILRFYEEMIEQKRVKAPEKAAPVKEIKKPEEKAPAEKSDKSELKTSVSATSVEEAPLKVAKDKKFDELISWYESLLKSESGGGDLSPDSWEDIDEQVSIAGAEDEELPGIEGEEEDEEDLVRKIAQLTVPEKELLARTGSVLARSILIRDGSKSVALAVVNSPKATEEEIERYAKLKNIDKDVLREIARNREWRKSASIRRALVMNPRTPPDVSLTLAKTLIDQDLKYLAKSHEIPEVLRAYAQRMLKKREEIKGAKKSH